MFKRECLREEIIQLRKEIESLNEGEVETVNHLDKHFSPDVLNLGIVVDRSFRSNFSRKSRLPFAEVNHNITFSHFAIANLFRLISRHSMPG